MTPAAAPRALTGSDQQVVTGPATYRGYSLRETASAAAVVRVWDGTSAAGTLLDTVALAADGSAQAWHDGGGIRAASGVFVEVVSGAVEGSVRIG
jgi:hypothetical protein